MYHALVQEGFFARMFLLDIVDLMLRVSAIDEKTPREGFTDSPLL